ncbi:hypothetical protein C7H61_12915 [Mesoflavibacter zeaxanthinifaciens subsp. sabulilitoris]|uniref:Uncharacterized protein n=1 Tax=Mesoflavibacter zeaxanthinifaciens subsp. sabulilitoris TaxID=1520893 RepID=A0A2T1N5Z0_9FLAO|nr:hypothetical protein C7H61_12915 [Mesoflavibacter zeaxanthinifaciens subsp. sabulilitoris]
MSIVIPSTAEESHSVILNASEESLCHLELAERSISEKKRFLDYASLHSKLDQTFKINPVD